MIFLKNKKNLPILLLCGFVFLVSIAYSFYFQIKPLVDARAYDMIAQNIVAGNGYRESLNTPLADDNAIMRVGPGYEFFLAAVYFIFGHHYSVVWILQALFHALTALLVFLTARTLFDGYQDRDIVAFTSALFIGLSPDLITMSGMLMTETLGIFLLTGTCFVFIWIVNKKDDTLAGAFLVGIVLGITAMVRTPAIFLLIPIGFYYLIQKNFFYILTLGLGIVFVFSPWILRNFNVYHTFVPTNLAYGIDLAAGNHYGASGELEPYTHNDEIVMQYGKVEGTRKLTMETITFVLSHPIEFLMLTASRASIYFSFARPTGFWFHLSGINKIATLILSAIYSTLLFTFGFFGIAKIKNLPILQHRMAWLLLSMLVMTPLSIIGIIVETRYRFLSYPFFALFAGYGVNELRKAGSCLVCFATILFLLLANSTLDIFRNISRIINRIHGL